MVLRKGCVKSMEKTMNETTCDISDKLHPDVQYLDPVYKIYGAKLHSQAILLLLSVMKTIHLLKKP